MPQCAIVVGATGGIGETIVQQLLNRYPGIRIHACGRNEARLDSLQGEQVQTWPMDILDESDLEGVAAAIRNSDTRPDRVLITSGILHDDKHQPERRIEDLDSDWLQKVFRVNTIGPTMVAKHFLPVMAPDRPGIFAVWSARVGSIGDNRLGGWYGYRASKAALNQIIRTLSIEADRRFKNLQIIGLHPGTVDTGLSEPFQANVKPEKLFSPEQSANYLLDVMENLPGSASGNIYDWKGERIEP